MLKFIQNTRIPSLVFGLAALIALISAAPVTPAAAQGVPAGLLRLDSSQGYSNDAQLAEVQQPCRVGEDLQRRQLVTRLEWPQLVLTGRAFVAQLNDVHPAGQRGVGELGQIATIAARVGARDEDLTR